MSHRAAMPLVVFLVVLAAATAVRGDEAAYKEALEVYEAKIDRPPLSTRLGGIRRLAGTRDPRALAILAARYAKPRVPKDHERYLVASSIGRSFGEKEHVDALSKLRRAHRTDENAWLWFHASRAEARGVDPSALAESIRSAKTRPFLRAALLERLASERRVEALPLVVALVGEELPRKGPARTLLLESAASVLLAFRDAPKAPGFAEAARGVVDLLARDDVRERTKLVIARYLARTFRIDKVTTDHTFWRRMLAALEPVANTGETVAGRPRFFGLEAAGTRVVYVIDLSDSMLDPLTPREKADAERLSNGAGDEGNSIRWPTIRSRFDLARAYLKQSLLGLDPNVQFMVIGFGNQAEPFRSTKKLEPASSANVRAAVRELEDIEPGHVTRQRPHGTLRGATNLHGALLQAFQATSRRRIDQFEHVDEKALDDGCDTVFVFGDGRPNEDDFAATDRFRGGRITSDTETGATRDAHPGSARFYGPYRGTGNLLDDVHRMNLFRKAEIHTVAMGEADNDLMRRLADLGLGSYRSIGFLGRGGRVNAWWVVGPFPAADVESWEKAWAPEEGVALALPVRIGDEDVYWRRLFTSHGAGFVNLDREFEPRDRVLAYAFAEVFVERETEARLAIGSDDGIRVWLNDAVVHTNFVTRRWKAEVDKVDVILAKGWNRLLVKVCDGTSSWGFSVRILDRTGEALDFDIR